MRRRHWMLIGLVLLSVGFVWLYDRRPDPELLPSGAVPSEPETASPSLHGTRRDVVGTEERVESGRESARSPTGVLSGTVVDDGTGQPIVGARVVVLETDQAQADQSVQTDHEGFFRAELQARQATGELQSYADGYRLLVYSFDVEKEGTLELRMERGSSISGVVLDERGDPVPAARVWCHLPANWSTWPQRDEGYMVGGGSDGALTRTRADGTFLLEGLGAGQEYVLRCAKAGRRQHVIHSENNGGLPVATGGARDVRLWLTTAFDVRLVATDSESGKPLQIAPTWVVGNPAGFQGETGHTDIDDIEASQGLLGDNAACETRGHAVPGKHALGNSIRLIAEVVGYKPVSASIALSSLQGTVHNVPFEPASRTDMLGVAEVVPHFAGVPFRGFLAISVSRVDGPAQRGSSAFRMDFTDSGKAALSLPEGLYRLRAQGTGSQGEWWRQPSEAQEVNIQPGTRTVVRLQLRGNPVALTVRDAAGRLRGGFGLQVSLPGRIGHWVGGWDLRVPEETEHARIVWVPKGEVVLAAWMEGIGYGTASVAADGTGSPLDISIELVPGTEPRSSAFTRRLR